MRVSRYTTPELNGHNVVYKGKRYWVIEVTEELPLEWVTADQSDYAIYDKSIGYVMASITRTEGGQMEVSVPAQVTDHRFVAESFKEAVGGAASQMDYLDRNGWG